MNNNKYASINIKSPNPNNLPIPSLTWQKINSPKKYIKINVADLFK
jgi:hypothetical protein